MKLKNSLLVLLSLIFLFSVLGCNEKESVKTHDSNSFSAADSKSEKTVDKESIKTRNEYSKTIFPNLEHINSDSEDRFISFKKIPYYYYLDEMLIAFEQTDEGYRDRIGLKYEGKFRKASDNSDYIISDYKTGICINLYIGNESNVIIPSKLDGKPVIKLGGFLEFDTESGYDYQNPFERKKVKTITLPPTLKEIVQDSLGVNNSYLETINVDSDNSYYTSVDGILYSKDKSILLQIPTAYKEKKLKILNGTKAVYSLGYKNSEELFIPSSVISFGESFDGDGKRKRVNVFYNHMLPLSGELTKYKRITVDKKNRFYSSSDGVLYSKDKTELLKYPVLKKNKRFVVPDTVTSIADTVDLYSEYLSEITFEVNVKEINAFFTDFRDKGFTIKGYSVAKRFTDKQYDLYDFAKGKLYFSSLG